MEKLKGAMKGQLDDYQAAMQQHADDGKPGFKEKLPQVKQEVAEAKKFIDGGFEESVDMAAQQAAQQRQQNKLLAEKYAEKGAEGQAWKDDFAGRPDKAPDGQRADVQSALDQVSQLAADKITEIQPLGSKAAPATEKLKKVQAWTAELKPKVPGKGRELTSAKTSAKTGVAETRAAFAEAGKLQDSAESEGNENMDVFQRWTDHNNRLAQTWINSDSPKHKQWAEEWLKTQK
ncbi:MAG: hypothetical protein HY763_00420 [Planctomycetes bacterium]|nr:hypothetical protein [Planctomycetota bacterium]